MKTQTAEEVALLVAIDVSQLIKCKSSQPMVDRIADAIRAARRDGREQAIAMIASASWHDHEMNHANELIRKIREIES